MPRDNLRKGRASLPGCAYHIIACTHERFPLFSDYAYARVLVAEMRRLHDAAEVDSLAWVIMPDHLHWLFQLGERASLSAIVKQLKARSARAVGRRIEVGRVNEFARAGLLWQRGFYDHAIRSDEDLRAVARYIVANPLRAGLVDHLGDYPWWDAVWLAGE